MKKASKMIDLGRKPASLESKAEPRKDEPYYPSMSLSSDTPINFPKGHFMAKMKLKVKRSEASTDETGKARHSYHVDLHGVHPEFEDVGEASPATETAAEKVSENADDKDDAATAIMKSMGRKRREKMAASDDKS